MKYVILSLVVPVFFVNILSADEVAPHKAMQVSKSTIFYPGNYSRILEDLIDGVNKLDLNATQKNQLKGILKNDINPVIVREKEYKSANLKIIYMLNELKYNDNEIKNELNILDQLNKEILDKSMKAILSVRKVIGLEKFKKIDLFPINQNEKYIQLR